MYECKECGYKTKSIKHKKVCPECSGALEEIVDSGMGNQKRNSVILTAVVCVIIVIAIGVIAVMENAQKKEKNNQESDINPDVKLEVLEQIKMDEFIEKVGYYTPGIMTETGYESEFWGIRWTPGENWIVTDSEKLKKFEEEEKTRVVAEVEKELKAQNWSESTIELYKSSIYSNAEAGYECSGNGAWSGNAIVITFAAYTGEDNIEKSADYIMTKFSEVLSDITDGTATLGGQTYKYIEGKYDENINTRIYVRNNDVMNQVFQVNYADGCEYLIEEFENSVSAY